MDIILNNVTDYCNTGPSSFIGIGTLVNGQRHGLWKFGAIYSTEFNYCRFQSFYTIEYQCGQIVHKNVGNSSISIDTEYCAGNPCRTSTISTRDHENSVVEVSYYYTDLATKQEVRCSETIVTHPIKDIKFTKDSYLHYANGDFEQRQYAAGGQLVSAIGSKSGNKTVSKYIHSKLSHFTKQARKAINDYPNIFDNLLIYRDCNGRKLVDQTSSHYTILEMTSREIINNNEAQTITQYKMMTNEILTEKRFYYNGQRLGITEQYYATFKDPTPVLKKKYFAVGNRKLNISESPVECNSELTEAISAYYKLKYK